jgi:hypothetical protein
VLDRDARAQSCPLLDAEKEFVHPLHDVAHDGRGETCRYADAAAKQHERNLLRPENVAQARQLPVDAVAHCARELEAAKLHLHRTDCSAKPVWTSVSRRI